MSLRKLSTNSLGDKNRTFLLNVPDGSNMQIQLPPISKSSTDQKQLTIWPGRSNSSKIQLRKNIGVTSHEILEEKLNDQINKLMKTNESKSHLAHLQIHDEIFELCLQQFETFRPLLTRIKHSYNQTINYLQHEVQSLLPLKQTLVTMVEKAEKRLIHYKEQERQEIVELKRLCQEKDHKINLLSEDKLQMNLKVEKVLNFSYLNFQIKIHNHPLKLSHQLGEEYKAFRMEAEARKLLITEINELRYRQDDKSIHSQSGTGKDDPKLLKIALQFISRE
ncbi:hypothetical protein SNEBB_008465 [Seison nebaliae]|nr:hypothetical protein SNEBB_008465 [Seison nebaliae]